MAKISVLEHDIVSQKVKTMERCNPNRKKIGGTRGYWEVLNDE